MKKNRFKQQDKKKTEWISNKISDLMNEDPSMPQKQAIAMAYSYWDRRKAQDGFRFYQYDEKGNPNINFVTENAPKVDTSNITTDLTLDGYKQPEDNETLKNMEFAKDVTDYTPSQTINFNKKEAEQPFGQVQFFNPYGGVDIPTASTYLGQSIENNDTLGILAGATKVATGVARNIFGGMGQANLKNEAMKSYYDNQRETISAFEQGGRMYYQDGGEEPLMEEEHDDLINKYPNRGRQVFTDSIPPQLIPEQQVENNPQQAQPSYDVNSARDTWEAKTGLPWSEAKRLGYTDGSAKDNMKLLSELNDPRFNKKYLRSKPLPKAKEQVVKPTPTFAPKPAPKTNNKPAPKTNNRPAYKNPYQISQATEHDWLDKTIEYLGNPIQTFGHYAKYGELPSPGFSRHNQNDLDQVLDMINPAGWASHTMNAAKEADQGQWKEAGEEILGSAGALGKVKYVKYVPLPKSLPPRKAKAISEGVKRLGMEEGGYYQDGGQQDQMQQVVQMVAEAMQQGADPRQILDQLIQMGMSQEQATMLIQQVANQLQGQSGQEEQMEGQMSNPQEEQAEMKCGGKKYKNGGDYLEVLKNKRIIGYTYNKDTDSYTIDYE